MPSPSSLRSRTLVGALALCGACAEVGSLSLSPGEGDPPPADGMAVVTIRATALAAERPVIDGTRVSFRASEPLLFGSPEEALPAVPGARPVGSRHLEASTWDSRAEVYLLAPTDQGAIELEARFSPEPGIEVSAARAVEFGPPPLVSAGSGHPTLAGGVTVQFDLDCATDTIGALLPDRGDIVVPCRLVMQDHQGRSLPHTPVRLFAEAGELIDLPATPDAPRSILYVVRTPIARYPVDVPPLPDEEPFVREGAGPIPGALERNPRDGLVTLMVAVRGHEAYADLNDNGQWDPGEPFVDEGEPFLDVDDDGVHDPAMDGPRCCARDGSGEVAGPNGRWDQDVWIGRTFHILWTGPVEKGADRSRIDGPADLAAGGTGAYEITLVDDNFNPITRGADGALSLHVGGPVSVPPTELELATGSGLVVENRFPRHIFGSGEPVVTGLELDGTRRWELELRDARAPGAQCVEGEWAISAELRHGPGGLGATAWQRVTRILRTGRLLERAQCP